MEAPGGETKSGDGGSYIHGGEAQVRGIPMVNASSPPPPPPLPPPPLRRSSRNRRIPDVAVSSPLLPSPSQWRSPKPQLPPNPNSKKKSNDPTRFTRHSITPEAPHEGSWSSRLRSRCLNRPLRPTVRAEVAVLRSADLDVRTTPVAAGTDTKKQRKKNKSKEKSEKKDNVMSDSPKLHLPVGEDVPRAEGKKKEKEAGRSDERILRRSPRLSLLEERKNPNTHKSQTVTEELGGGDMEDLGKNTKRNARFLASTPSRLELKKDRTVKKSSSNGYGVGKNLDSQKEVAVTLIGRPEEEVEMVIPRDGYVDSVGRIGAILGSMQRDKFSTPTGTIEEKKRKRSKESGDGECGHGSQGEGWTYEQDKVLQVAYLKARPSPHFWKKVAKMVPGKSSKECFDRIHSNYITPPLPRRNTRTKQINLSPVSHFNLSASKLSVSLQKTIKKSKKNQKILARRMVRHILRKHSSVDHGQEADLFPIFQACMDASAPETICRNTPAKGSSILSTGFPNNNRKQLCARNLDKENKPSPEVLKKLRNPTLHEKYIDQLHCREARWKVSSRIENRATTSAGFLENAVPQIETVKDARNTLLLEAKEAITKFQHPKLPTDNDVDSEDENGDDEYDESEMEDAFIGF